MSGRGRPGALRLPGQSPAAPVCAGGGRAGFAWGIRTAAGKCSSKRSTGGWWPPPSAGKNVVRLKSGDPYLFGRGAEEVEALAAAGIPYEVVPGVTAAFAAASHAGIPITHRDLASAVALITGHRRGDGAGQELDYEALAQFPGTLVFYMGMTTCAAVERSPVARRPIARHAGGHRAPRYLARPGDDPLHVGHRGRPDRDSEEFARRPCICRG